MEQAKPIAIDVEILISLLEEHHNEIMHTELHRQMVISLVLTLVTAAIAVFSFELDSEKTSHSLNLLPVLVIALGLFGVIVVQKLYERQVWYQDRREQIIKALDQCASIQLSAIYGTHESTHRRKFPLRSKIRMNALWTVLNLFVVLMGVTMLVLGSKWMG